MCRSAGNDLKYTFLLQLAKCIDQVSLIPLVPKVERSRKTFNVHLCDIIKLDRLFVGSTKLFAGKIEKILEMPRVPFFQQFVRQHLA